MRLERQDDHWRLIGGPVPPGMAAVTIWSLVSVRERSAGNERLARHEAAHVRQWRRYGVVGFLLRYLGTYVLLRLRAYPHIAAYRRLPLEVEAEWTARSAADTAGPPA